jgi:hypothetical protein
MIMFLDLIPFIHSLNDVYESMVSLDYAIKVFYCTVPLTQNDSEEKRNNGEYRLRSVTANTDQNYSMVRRTSVYLKDL